MNSIPMSRTSFGLSFLTISLCLIPSLVAYAQPQPRKSLFDGQSLDGWEYDDRYWSVDSGVIVGEIPRGQTLGHNTWMIWRGGELRDFDLQVMVKLTGKPSANSGIQIRCQAKDPGQVSGYQADLDMGATWLGRIYDEHGRALLVERGQRVLIDENGQRTVQTFAPAGMFATIFRENDWNVYRIVGIGDRITVFVNGTLFSELVDRETNERDLSGQLALQLHSGPETRVEFRDIYLETLASDDNRLGQFRLPDSETKTKSEAKSPGRLAMDSNGKPLNLDFETGDLSDWTATGTAFKGQPVDKDTISGRWAAQVSNKQGRFFIGGYELSHSDAAQGTLTSVWFDVTDPFVSFLIAGGRSSATRVDVLLQVKRGDTVSEEIIFTRSGDQREQMRRVVVDLQEYQGQKIAVRLVDASSGGWGHLNFDDFRFHRQRPEFAATAGGPLFHPLLHHLVPNSQNADVTGDTLAKMSVPKGFCVDLIAAEPQVHQPMAFTFDARGRLWVVEGHSYPTKRPAGEGLDKILIFEDADHNGTFENRKVFFEGLNLVSGMQVGYGGVWIGAAPELLFIPDRDQDDAPDSKPIVLLNGFGYGDTHETLNSFIWGPDGWLYGNQGVFNESQVGKPGTNSERRIELSAGVWRYHPVRHEFEVFAHGGSNQWGLDFDDHGQLFMTHCRSNWGRGSTTHVMQGAHYWNQINNGYAPFISRNPVAGIPGMRNFMLASARYGHGEGGAGKPGSRALYGGHSHVGTMIYQGDNWPSKYRNHLFTHNLHGHRMNHQINLREGGGFNTVHAGYDVFHCSDPQYIGVDLQCGPDGAVYVSDWYDPRHCHSPHTEQWQRGNGRMYRMRFDGFQPANVNYSDATDMQLAEAQLHANEWHVRMARLVLTERSVHRNIEARAVRRLSEIATTHAVPARRLRAIWCLHGIGLFDRELATQGIADGNEYVRAWTVQLLAESNRIAERVELIQRTLAVESSPIVRLYLASAAGRMPAATAWSILEKLSSQRENALERNLPLLIWHMLGPLVPTDVDRADRLIDMTKIPIVRHSLCWYLPQVSEKGRELLTRRIVKTKGLERVQTLRLFAAGLAGSRDLKQPESWASVAAGLYSEPSTRESAKLLGAVFGDKALYEELREVLQGDGADLPSREQALALLANSNDAANLPILLKHIDVPQLRLSILRQLSRYRDPQVAVALIRRLPRFSGTETDAAMEALCSRSTSALALLDAMQAGRVEKTLLTSYFARQMASLGDVSVTARLEQQWGKLTPSSDETKSDIANLVSFYKKAPRWAYNRNNGAGHFNKLCATCHVDSKNAPRIGPKLDGTGSKGIEYIVENIMDPNAVVGKDFQARNVVTADGLVITGVVIKETRSAITVRTATTTKVIARDEIEEIVATTNSFMPEGLLQELSDRERIELLMYIMSL